MPFELLYLPFAIPEHILKDLIAVICLARVLKEALYGAQDVEACGYIILPVVGGYKCLPFVLLDGIDPVRVVKIIHGYHLLLTVLISIDGKGIHTHK